MIKLIPNRDGVKQLQNMRFRTNMGMALNDTLRD